MADSNSTAPRCPCGFWGTPQTGGLCSKCYKDKEQKLGSSSTTSVGGATSIPMTGITRTVEQDADSSPEVTCDVPESNSSTDTTTSETTDATESSTTVGSTTEGATEGTSSENGAKKRDSSEVAEVEAEAEEDTMDVEEDLPVQKNKKRCFKCNTRLELAIREIGRCQCSYVFCQLHRLPEQHDCIYDHKEKGRKQARDKMISPKKHAGTSIKRMDSSHS